MVGCGVACDVSCIGKESGSNREDESVVRDIAEKKKIKGKKRWSKIEIKTCDTMWKLNLEYVYIHVESE